jgi:hypothetical protein
MVTPVRVSVDEVAGADWDRLLSGFSDATIYQSAAYGQARWGSKHTSRVMLTRDGKVVALAQARVVKAPLLHVGVAYVGWGPAWRPRGTPEDPSIFRAAIRALRDEYAQRRGLFLRIVPNLFTEAEWPRQLLAEEGFAGAPLATRTILLDLTVPTEALRAGLRRRWRQTLARAERDDQVEWVEGTTIGHYEEALGVYDEMHQRKRFTAFVDVAQFRVLQDLLPPELRMRVLIARMSGTPIAAIAWSAVGDTGLPLLSATGRRALENDAAYVMWWRMLTRMKADGLTTCDLGGINPDRNPGGYTFKSGMAKTHGREVQLLGEFGVSTSPVSRAAASLAQRGKLAVVRWRLWNERRRRANVQPPLKAPSDGGA